MLRKKYLNILIYFLISVLFCSCLNKKIVISNQITEEIYITRDIKKNDIILFEWEHSFEHIIWREYYRLSEENIFELFSIAVEGFGAGIPAEMDCTYRYEDGMIYMENIKGSSFKEFNWINSKEKLKKISINDKEIIRGQDLPEREKIKLSIK